MIKSVLFTVVLAVCFYEGYSQFGGPAGPAGMMPGMGSQMGMGMMMAGMMDLNCGPKPTPMHGMMMNLEAEALLERPCDCHPFMECQQRNGIPVPGPMGNYTRQCNPMQRRPMPMSMFSRVCCCSSLSTQQLWT